MAWGGFGNWPAGVWGSSPSAGLSWTVIQLPMRLSHCVLRSVPACLPEGLCSNSVIFENISEVLRENSLLVSLICTIYSLRNEDVVN